VRNVQHEDSGFYVCIATNDAGTSRDFGHLTVEGKTLAACFCITTAPADRALGVQARCLNVLYSVEQWPLNRREKQRLV